MDIDLENNWAASFGAILGSGRARARARARTQHRGTRTRQQHCTPRWIRRQRRCGRSAMFSGIDWSRARR